MIGSKMGAHRDIAAAGCVGAWCCAGGAWAGSNEVGPGTLSEIVLFPAMFATVAFLLWVLADHFQQRARMRMQLEIRLKLLDRINSIADVAALLADDKDSRLLSALVEDERPDFTHRVIATVRAGVILVMTGAGLLMLAALNTLGGGAIFMAFAVLLLAVGSGFLLAALAAWRLGVGLGLAGTARREAIELRTP